MNASDKLSGVELKSGGHESVEDGMCAMEAVAWLAGEPHSDHPACASPVLAAYVRRLNDSMRDDQRQKLKPYLAKLIGSAAPALDAERTRVLAWAALTEFAPAGLRTIGLVEHADRMASTTKYHWVAAVTAAEYAAVTAAEYAARAAEYADECTSCEYANHVVEYAVTVAEYSVTAAEDADECTADATEYAAASAEYVAARAANAAHLAHAAHAAPANNVWDLALAALDRALAVK